MDVEIREGDQPVFALHTERSSYVFCVDQGLLRHLHWGGRLDVADVIVEPLWELSTNDLIQDVVPQEYPAHGRFRYNEACLAVRFPDGGRELDLRYESHRAEGGALVVTLADARGVRVDLHYEVLAQGDAIRRWAQVRTGVDLVVESVASAQFHVPFRDLTLHNVAGRWGAEFQEIRQPVAGKVVLESRRGISNHHHNPFAVLSRAATETAGQVWGAACAFSGNTRVVAELTQYGQTLVQLGVNDADLEIPLAAGATLRTPAVVATWTDAGFDALSQNFHDYGRSLMVPGPRPVLYNSWEATGFAVDADGQKALAARAARIGAELFVLDDGWFGRRNPGADGGICDGLGDWWVDPVKFPEGLTPLIEQVHRLGMRFGLWVEPEMVNPESDLFAGHPEWIYHEPGREADTARGQYVLNLTLPQVEEFVLRTLDDLICSTRTTSPISSGTRTAPCPRWGPLATCGSGTSMRCTGSSRRSRPGIRACWWRRVPPAVAGSISGRCGSSTISGPVTTPTRWTGWTSTAATRWSTPRRRCGPGSPTCRTSCPSAASRCSSASTAR